MKMSDKKNRILFFGVLTLLSLLMVGASRLKSQDANSTVTDAKRQVIENLLEGSNGIPEGNRAGWDKVVRERPLLMLRINSVERRPDNTI
jgi:hypothetical protein